MHNGPTLRHRLIAIAIVALIFSADISSLRAADIYWLDSPQQAAQASRRLGLPVVMYITSEHCGYCRKMERESWANRDIAKMVQEGFVPLKVHASRHAELVKALGVQAFPTTILFSAQAETLAGAAGFLSPSQLAGFLRKAGASQSIQETKPPMVASHLDDSLQPIAWHQSAAAAFQIAQQSHRPVVVYVSSEQCGYCRKMERDVWVDPTITSLVQADYIPLALRAGRDDELVAALNVKAYPTTILLSPERKIIAGLAGYVPVTGLTELLKNARPQGLRPARLPVPVASR